MGHLLHKLGHCDSHMHTTVNKTYAIIDLNPNYKIISDEFTVHEIKEKIAMTYYAEPFKVKTFNIGNPSYYEFEDLKNQHTDLKKRTLTL